MPEILIVEDEVGVRIALEDQVRSIGNVHTCRSAAEAISHISRARGGGMDLAIVDLQHPRAGAVDPDAGFCVVEELERNGGAIPVIILTIRNDQDAWDKARGFSSVRYFFTKPWPAQSLRKAIKTCLAGKAAQITLVGVMEGDNSDGID